MRKAIIICFTTVCMSLAFIQMAGAIGSEEAYRHLEQGNALHKAGKYKQATEEFKAAWEGGKLLDACFNLALTYDRDLNENRLAIKYYNEFLAMDSQSHEAEEVRSLEESARQEITQTGWWFDKQATEQTKKDEDDIIAKVKEFQKASALEDTEGRPEDKITGQGHICFGCHAGFMGPQINMAATHPVGRVPKGDLAKTVPKSVRFYKEGQVICLSCHNEQNLHFEAGTAGINYKYLRVTTGGKEDMPKFCAFCHSSKSARRYLEGEGDDSRGGLELRR